MLPTASSVEIGQDDERLDRSNSDAVGSAAMLVRNVEEAVRWVPPISATYPRANVSSHQVFTAAEQDAPAQIIDPPPMSVYAVPTASLHALQEWEGYVVDVRMKDFVARLVDLTSGSAHEEEEAVIPRAELSDGDDAKMRAGSIFRWVIGYERSSAGTKRRISQIVFRDLPAVTKNDLRDGEVWATEMARSLNP